jgi:hypothetical protein
MATLKQHLWTVGLMLAIALPAGASTYTPTRTPTVTPTKTRTYTARPTATLTTTQTPTQTPTVTLTGTITPTFALTPFSQRTPLPGGIPNLHWTSSNSGTLVTNSPPGNLACIVSYTLSPATASDTITLLDTFGTTIFTTTGAPITNYVDKYGPCVFTPVTMIGTGTVTLGWYSAGPSPN